MIAVDTNLLLYAHRSDLPFHERALAVITALAEGRAAWAIPWPCVHEFLATSTHPKVFKPPTRTTAALAALDAWCSSPTLQLLHERPDHLIVLRDLIDTARIVGARVHDARIAAICIGNGVRELWSADRDFRRFPSLTVRNPLLG